MIAYFFDFWEQKRRIDQLADQWRNEYQIKLGNLEGLLRLAQDQNIAVEFIDWVPCPTAFHASSCEFKPRISRKGYVIMNRIGPEADSIHLAHELGHLLVNRPYLPPKKESREAEGALSEISKFERRAKAVLRNLENEAEAVYFSNRIMKVSLREDLRINSAAAKKYILWFREKGKDYYQNPAMMEDVVRLAKKDFPPKFIAQVILDNLRLTQNLIDGDERQ